MKKPVSNHMAIVYKVCGLAVCAVATASGTYWTLQSVWPKSSWHQCGEIEFLRTADWKPLEGGGCGAYRESPDPASLVVLDSRRLSYPEFRAYASKKARSGEGRFIQFPGKDADSQRGILFDKIPFGYRFVYWRNMTAMTGKVDTAVPLEFNKSMKRGSPAWMIWNLRPVPRAGATKAPGGRP